jgi:hypothetical protein
MMKKDEKEKDELSTRIWSVLRVWEVRSVVPFVGKDIHLIICLRVTVQMIWQMEWIV